MRPPTHHPRSAPRTRRSSSCAQGLVSDRTSAGARLRRLLDPRPDTEVMPDFGYPKENIVFISGIGCSAACLLHEHVRLPHDPWSRADARHRSEGRAPGPHGLVITGDGDALSIGGNHVLHSIAATSTFKLIMFNNRIYGLTKGRRRRRRRSARSRSRRRRARSTTRSCRLGRAGGRSHVRRALGRHAHGAPPEHARTGRLPPRLGVRRGSPELQHLHDGAWRSFTDREVRDDRMLVLEHGKPMIFGKTTTRASAARPAPGGRRSSERITEADLLVHDEKAEDPYLAFMLSRMTYPDFPFRWACCEAWTGRRTTSS